MPKATRPSGDLLELDNCYIKFGGREIRMKVLPDISDSKSAAYNDEPIIGRSFPMKTFSHSENRTISWTMHCVVCTNADLQKNMDDLRALESLVYPRDVAGAAPYGPPPIAKIRCGQLLSRDEDLCVILKSYSVKFPTEVAWDEQGYIPYKFDIDLTFETVYESSELPGQERILQTGR